MLSAHVAQAAEVVQVADNNGEPRRFMSLDSERDGTAHARARNNQPVTRSDRTAMSSGFMRIDRTRDAVIPLQRSLVAPTIQVPLAVTDSSKAVEKPKTATAVSNTDGPHVVAVPTEPDSEEVSSSADGDPVLSLFNSSGSGVLKSFHDALSGGAGGQIISTSKQKWPVDAGAAQQISSDYGMRSDPINGRPEFHGGIDISAPAGTPVLATAEATVMKVDEDANYGKYITLLHTDGIESHYGHLSAQSVSEGQHVNPGQVIGAVGATGRTTGAHLDYRLSMNGAKIDPMTVLTPPTGVQGAHATRPGTSSVAQASPRSSYRPMARPIRDMQVKVVTVD